MIDMAAGAIESLRVPWSIDRGDIDPREAPAIAVEFQLVAEGSDPDPGGWDAGSWEAGDPTPETIDGARVTAYWSRTPTIGADASGAAITAAAGLWVLWGRLVDVAERLPRMVDYVNLR